MNKYISHTIYASIFSTYTCIYFSVCAFIYYLILSFCECVFNLHFIKELQRICFSYSYVDAFYILNFFQAFFKKNAIYSAKLTRNKGIDWKMSSYIYVNFEDPLVIAVWLIKRYLFYKCKTNFEFPTLMSIFDNYVYDKNFS
jgi:hypothetical protein